MSTRWLKYLNNALHAKYEPFSNLTTPSNRLLNYKMASNDLKLYLQKKSSKECLVENCFSCPKTPTIKRLKNYMTSPL